MKIKCKCGKVATWALMSYSEQFDTIDKITNKRITVKAKDIGIVPFACDDCVPRGCSCQSWDVKSSGLPKGIEGKDWKWLEKDTIYLELNGNGTEMPCCEWEYEKEGWDDEN